MSHTEEQFEKILRSLPRFARSAAADAQFMTELKRRAALRASTEPRRTKAWYRLPFRRLAFAGSFLVLLAFTSVTVWAYQPMTTRGHFLYPWKQAGETAELAFAFTPLQKINAHLRFSDRRLEESEQILRGRTSAAVLIQQARAADDSGASVLTAEEYDNLNATLEDMRSQVERALTIVENEVTATETAGQMLKKIAQKIERHSERLEEFTKNTSEETKTIIETAAASADDQLAAVIEAEDKANEAHERNEKTIRVQLKREEKREKNMIKAAEKRAKREREASDEVDALNNLFESLPADQKARFEEKIEKAKEALTTEKLGRAKGLSRSVRNKIEKLLNEDDEKSDGGDREDRENLKRQ